MSDYLKWFETAKKIPAEAGDAVTLSIGSDSYPGTILDNTGLVWKVRFDREKIVSGSAMDGSAEYEYYADPEGREAFFKRDRKGNFVEVSKNPETGRWVQTPCFRLHRGVRRYYRDPHF